MSLGRRLLLGIALVVGAASASAGELPSIKPVVHVDLPRFMGRWYVIATIPTRFERSAWNAVETYELQPQGSVYTTFRFNSGAFEGPVKHIHSIGYVQPDSGNAVWGVQLFWPIKAQYIVAYLRDDYSQTIVARDARDYTWIMARTPSVLPADYAALIACVKALGYDVSKIRKVPQRWPDRGASSQGKSESAAGGILAQHADRLWNLKGGFYTAPWSPAPGLPSKRASFSSIAERMNLK